METYKRSIEVQKKVFQTSEEGLAETRRMFLKDPNKDFLDTENLQKDGAPCWKSSIYLKTCRRSPIYRIHRIKRLPYISIEGIHKVFHLQNTSMKSSIQRRPVEGFQCIKDPHKVFIYYPVQRTSIRSSVYIYHI